MDEDSLIVQVNTCGTQYESLINVLISQVESELKNARPPSEVPTSTTYMPDLQVFQKTLRELYQMELKLKEILDDVSKHKQINSNINRMNAEMEVKGKEDRAIVKSFHNKIEGFSSLLQNSKHLLSSNHKNVDSSFLPVDVKELLLYSARVAKHTLSALTPPIPQEDQIRLSRLFAIGDELASGIANQENGAGTENGGNMNAIKIDMGLDETGRASSSAQDGSVKEDEDSAEDLLDLF